MNNSHSNSNQVAPSESAELNKQSKPGSALGHHESDQLPRVVLRQCKNHPEIEATRICLYAGCSLSREICEECQLDHPHSTHPEMVIEAKNFFAETEVNLRNLSLNSPQSVAMELLQQGRLFFLKHFQSMNNILIEKSPVYLKVLGLIEQSKGVGAGMMGTYELERYVRELMTVFEITQSGKFQPIPELVAQFKDVTLKQSVNEIYLMLREIENAMIVLHDNFASVLKFQTNAMDFNEDMQNDHNKNFLMGYKSSNLKGNRKGLMQTNENSQMSSENSFGGGYTGNQFAGNKKVNNQQAMSVLLQNGRTSNVKNEDVQIHQVKNTNNSQVPTFAALNQQPQQQLIPSEAHQALINTREAFLDPAFLKRSRGRPKGSKCKRKGKLKSKYTTEEKLQILKEVENTKSVQVVAEKHLIQNSLIRQWARQLKYELDPQTVASRRPYRTFSREKKGLIVAEAIFKRDIVLVAQEHDVNAQVLKRWILKSAQGEMLPQQEMRQLMNGMDGEGDEEDGEDGDEGDGDEEEDEDEEEEEEEEGVDEEEEDGDDEEDDDEDEDEENEDIKENQKEGKLDKKDKDKGDKKQSKDSCSHEKSEQIYSASNHEDQGVDEETKNEYKTYEEDMSLGEQTKKKLKIESILSTDPHDKQMQQPQQHPQEQQQKQLPQQHLQPSSSTDKATTVQVREMLKFDVLQTVDLKNLDINSDTKQQQENLQMMREQISKEILRLKQAQQSTGKQRNVTINNNNNVRQ